VSYGVTCIECGGDLPYFRDRKSSKEYCSPKCRYKARDRARYAANPDRERERSRRYYAEHREEILEKAAAKRGQSRPRQLTECSECGDPLAGRQRVICGTARCRERRFKRLHPEAYAERERKKVERRRAKRRAARAGESA
jgi:hypothetical protein